MPIGTEHGYKISYNHGTEVRLGPGDFVLDGDPATLPKKGAKPQFLAHVYCDQTAGWTKLALGMEVGLSPGDFVLDEDPASPPQKGGKAPSPICSCRTCF